MTLSFKKALAGTSLVLLALSSQSALADGWHHGYGHSYRHGGPGWVPFAIGAVVGGIAVNAMMQPQPVILAPQYYRPAPIVIQPRAVMPAQGYGVPVPPPIYHSY